MMDGTRISVTAILLAAGLSGFAGRAGGAGFAAVAPILQQRCVLCHQGPAAAAGLRLDSLAGVLAGSDRGPVVQAGDPDASELVRRIRGTRQPRMPMSGPPFLSDAEIAIIEAWVADGLKGGGPVAGVAVPPTRLPGPGEPVTYRHVAPIFATRCAKCHTDKGLMGGAPEGFRLTSYAATLATGERVRVVPGNPGASLLVRHIRGQERPRMPYDGPPYLSDAEIRLIERWIVDGAADANGVPAPVPVGARVKLHGTLEAGNRLDGMALLIGPHTRIDKRPRPGDRVRVRGYLNGAGQVEVERLRRR